MAGWRKPTEQIISNHEGFFQSLNKVGEVIVLGHSMTNVDMPYFQKIKDNISPNATWEISVFDEHDHQRKIEAVEESKLEKNNLHFFHLQDISLNREGDIF